MSDLPNANQYPLPLGDTHPRIAERAAQVQAGAIASHLPNQQSLSDVLDPKKFGDLFDKL